MQSFSIIYIMKMYLAASRELIESMFTYMVE